MKTPTLLSAALALGLVAFASPSVAADKKAEPTKAAEKKAEAAKKKAELGIIEKLPTGKLEYPTTWSPPKSIPASEKVEGFYVEVPEHLKRSTDPYRYVMVSSSKEQSEARNRGNSLSGAPTCFTTAHPSMGNDLNWSGGLAVSATVQNYARANYGYGSQFGSVQMLRSERVVKETADKMTYEIKVAYVDAETMGVRLVSSTTVDFALVKELPGKLKVWGAKSTGEATFLVRRDRHEKERFHSSHLTVLINGSHSTSGSEGCPVTFSLKTGKNVAVNAVVQTETLLEVKNVKEEEEDGKRGIMPSLQGALPSFGQHEARLRPIKIGFSSTWMSQDTKPIVTVSHGWAGKERTQPL